MRLTYRNSDIIVKMSVNIIMNRCVVGIFDPSQSELRSHTCMAHLLTNVSAQSINRYCDLSANSVIHDHELAEQQLTVA